MQLIDGGWVASVQFSVVHNMVVELLPFGVLVVEWLYVFVPSSSSIEFFGAIGVYFVFFVVLRYACMAGM